MWLLLGIWGDEKGVSRKIMKTEWNRGRGVTAKRTVHVVVLTLHATRICPLEDCVIGLPYVPFYGTGIGYVTVYFFYCDDDNSATTYLRVVRRGDGDKAWRLVGQTARSKATNLSSPRQIRPSAITDDEASTTKLVK